MTTWNQAPRFHTGREGGDVLWTVPVVAGAPAPCAPDTGRGWKWPLVHSSLERGGFTRDPRRAEPERGGGAKRSHASGGSVAAVGGASTGLRGGVEVGAPPLRVPPPSYGLGKCESRQELYRVQKCPFVGMTGLTKVVPRPEVSGCGNRWG